MKKHRASKLYCSFCGKSSQEARQLIAGPDVFICDECVVEAYGHITPPPPSDDDRRLYEIGWEHDPQVGYP